MRWRCRAERCHCVQQEDHHLHSCRPEPASERTDTVERRRGHHVSGKGCQEDGFISRLRQSIRIFVLHKHKCNGLPVALLRRARVRAAVQHAQALGPGVYPAGVQHRREAAAAQPLKPLTNEQHLLG